MQAQIEAPKAAPALITRKDFKALLNISDSLFDRMKAGGELPKHTALGGAHRWNRAECLAWIDDGCPPMLEWSARRAAARK